MAANNSHQLLEKYFEKTRLILGPQFINDEQLKNIILNSGNEEKLNCMIGYLHVYMKSHPDQKMLFSQFINFIDESEYAMDQWIESIYFFDLWLKDHDRKSNLAKMMGYISCCTQSPENLTIKYKLKDILSNMLESYGFKG